MSNFRRSAILGVAWTGVQKWASRLSTMIAFVVVSRVLSPAEFGLVALATSLIGIFTVFVEGGMGAYVIQKAKLTPRVTSTAFWWSTLLAVVLAVPLVVFAEPISNLFGEAHLAPMIQVLSASLILASAVAIPRALLSRQLRFKALAACEIAASVASATIAVTMALTGFGAWALVMQYLSALVVSTVGIIAIGRWVPTMEWDWSETKPMLWYGAKVTTANLITVARTRGVDLIIGTFTSTTVLGIWVVAQRLLQILMDLFTAALSLVALPSFAKIKHDPARLHNAYSYSVSMCYLMMTPILICLIAFGDPVILWLFGSQWQAAIEPSQWLALGAFITTGVFLDRPLWLALGRPGAEVLLSGILAVLHILVAVLFAQYGLVVMTIAMAVRALISWPIRMLFLNRLAGLPMRVFNQVPRIAIAGVAMLAIAFASNLLPLPQLATVLTGGGVGIGIYLGVTWLTARPLLHHMGKDLKSLRKRR